MSDQRRVVYQGEKGAFSHLCAKAHFGDSAEYIGEKTFLDVFSSLKTDRADYGLLPIENSLVGSIHEVYDLLGQFGFCIVAEEYRRIHHCLLCNPSTLSKEDRMRVLDKVISHPKALGQCEQFLAAFPKIEKVIYYDTAGSAKDLSLSKEENVACIASKEAADIYNLQVLYENIEDDEENYTRFFVITKKPLQESQKKGNKVTLMLTLPHQSGALADLLDVLKKHELNLTKIESRPLIGKAFEYIFYIDFESPHLTENKTKIVLEKIRPKTTSLQLLGCYEAGKL